MKFLMFIILVIGSTATYAACEAEGAGDNNIVGNSNPDNNLCDDEKDDGETDGTNGFGDEDEEENEVELPRIYVMAFFPPGSWGGLSGMTWGSSLPDNAVLAELPLTEDDFGCNNSTENQRTRRAGLAYNVLYLYHQRQIANIPPSLSSMEWMEEHGTGTMWTTTWPDDSTSTMEVSGPGMSVVFTSESSNSCGT